MVALSARFFYPDFVVASPQKILIKEFGYFLMPCHQHGLCTDLLVQTQIDLYRCDCPCHCKHLLSTLILISGTFSAYAPIPHVFGISVLVRCGDCVRRACDSLNMRKQAPGTGCAVPGACSFRGGLKEINLAAIRATAFRSRSCRGRQ